MAKGSKKITLSGFGTLTGLACKFCASDFAVNDWSNDFAFSGLLRSGYEEEDLISNASLATYPYQQYNSH